jgi:hypothetical protein
MFWSVQMPNRNRRAIRHLTCAFAVGHQFSEAINHQPPSTGNVTAVSISNLELQSIATTRPPFTGGEPAAKCVFDRQIDEGGIEFSDLGSALLVLSR